VVGSTISFIINPATYIAYIFHPNTPFVNSDFIIAKFVLRYAKYMRLLILCNFVVGKLLSITEQKYILAGF